MWWHGDFATISADGQWFLHGRSDDTIKVAGKRLGPAEVETVIVGHPAVLEAAAIGVPDAGQGRVVVGVRRRAAGRRCRRSAARRAARHASPSSSGASFRPSAVRFTDALPKTRSAKILRRAIRAVATGTPPGDLSGLEDPAALDAIAAAH